MKIQRGRACIWTARGFFGLYNISFVFPSRTDTHWISIVVTITTMLWILLYVHVVTDALIKYFDISTILSSTSHFSHLILYLLRLDFMLAANL